jgi:hypothetical protein
MAPAPGERRDPLRVQLGEQEPFDKWPGRVVHPAPPATGGHDLGRVGDGDPQEVPGVRELDVGRQRPFAVVHRFGDDAAHPDVALQPRHVGGVAARRVNVTDVRGHEHGDGRQIDAALTERRQDLLDVPEEEAVGPDDDDALPLEREPVGVEEVRGPVQRDRGLAGAGATLRDEDAGERRPDDLVLLALDSGDDVAHAPRPRPLQCRQQGAGAG